MEDLELRKYALEKVLGLNLAEPEVIPELAAKFYNFLSPPPMQAGWGGTTEVIKLGDPATSQEYAVRPFNPRPLKPIEKATLKVITDLYRETEKVNGAEVSKVMNYAHLTQSNTAIKGLVLAGYCRRDRYKIIPLRDVAGNILPPMVQKVADGYAMGYKPLTAPIGTMGRVPT